MSASRDSPGNAKVSEADLIINRMNVALARSQRLINSWLPPKTPEDDRQASEDTDEEFKSMTDEAGIGSKAAYGDDTSSAALLHKKRLASGDKLLEQLLGKKAAQAHKKSQAGVKSMAASRHAAPKTLPNRPKSTRDDEGDSEEEGGRSAAFKSRRERKALGASVVEPAAASVQEDEVAQEQNVTMQEESNLDDRAKKLPHEKPATNKRGTSYLDELLTQKAKKKKKKAKHVVDH